MKQRWRLGRAVFVALWIVGCGGGAAGGNEAPVGSDTQGDDGDPSDGAQPDGGPASEGGAGGGSSSADGSSGGSSTTAGAAEVDCAALVVDGDPAAPMGAGWTYVSDDVDGEFVLEGILRAPAGEGPFPGVLVSHGKSGLPTTYSAQVAAVMVQWGMVAIATRYTHANDDDMRNGTLRPEGPEGASEANVARAHKTRKLLSCIDLVDEQRVAAHGHSMGAFVTAQLLGTHPDDARVASHTAGGVSPGPNATEPEVAAGIVVPYQLHHGDEDTVVQLALDEELAAIFVDHDVEHELEIYPGYEHVEMALDETMLDRVHDWYVAHGVLNR